jgi:hypothetical protein
MISNRDIGNAWTAEILGALFESWPKRQDFNALDLSATGILPRSEEAEELFHDLILWLEQENYITVGHRNVAGNAYQVALTGKGYSVLGSMPASLSQPLGSRLKDVAKEAGSEAGRQTIAGVVAMALGAASTLLGS